MQSLTYRFKRNSPQQGMNPRIHIKDKLCLTLIRLRRGYTHKELSERNKLTPLEEILTKNIAKARIHVERAIERIKKFRILSKDILVLQLPILNAMFHVFAFLVNFQEQLVK
ncbi:hypothetical protein ILUMI_20863 [Ignelater luminosus]|uniref:DDE Tnp4 domain-containing protein n=1 Tax=Ignelater luminosus TaxID=2038154 RepID=A0A8K0G468_IGNLU|nr:hypothetical protein ILUMI_20863 [Ignelater luminosus]